MRIRFGHILILLYVLFIAVAMLLTSCKSKKIVAEAIHEKADSSLVASKCMVKDSVIAAFDSIITHIDDNVYQDITISYDSLGRVTNYKKVSKRQASQSTSKHKEVHSNVVKQGKDSIKSQVRRSRIPATTSTNKNHAPIYIIVTVLVFCFMIWVSLHLCKSKFFK